MGGGRVRVYVPRVYVGGTGGMCPRVHECVTVMV